MYRLLPESAVPLGRFMSSQQEILTPFAQNHNTERIAQLLTMSPFEDFMTSFSNGHKTRYGITRDHQDLFTVDWNRQSPLLEKLGCNSGTAVDFTI